MKPDKDGFTLRTSDKGMINSRKAVSPWINAIIEALLLSLVLSRWCWFLDRFEICACVSCPSLLPDSLRAQYTMRITARYVNTAFFARSERE